MVKVLFDHNMPPSLAAALNSIIKKDGHLALPLREKFHTNIDDISYFKELAKEGNWIVISKDRKNAKRKPERTAILSSNVLAFYLKPSVAKQPLNEQAATLLWHWPAILRFRETLTNGMFELPINKNKKFSPI